MTSQFPAGTIPCPPYVEDRLVARLGNQSVDLIPTPAHPAWQEAFPDGDVPWETGWRALWQQAARSMATGTDYAPGRVSIEVQAYFANGTMASTGAIVDCDPDDLDEIDAAARRILLRAGRENEMIDGCIGLVSPTSAPTARPCLTLLVSGPGGGAEAAMLIRQALPEWGVSAGVAIRTVRSGSVGVVKIPFMPELYLKVKHPCFGLRWDVWRCLAEHSPSYEWGSACLLWCNAVVQSVHTLSERVGLMLDEVYFDTMHTVPLSLQATRDAIASRRANIGLLLRSAPESFLFGARGK